MEDVTKPCKDISKLTPQAQKACGLFLSECKKQGLNIFVTETYRSQARQTYLYEQGRTRKGQIVTNVKKVGYHNTGNAWDIACKGDKLYDDNILAKAGVIAKSLGIEWGGYWTGLVDKPHFQISSDWKEPVKTQAQNSNEYINALHVLMTNGIISNPEIWKNDKFTKENVHTLIIKVASKL